MSEDKKAQSPQEAYYFYYGNQLQAVRSGPWKLHFPHPYRTLNGGNVGGGGSPGRYAQAKTGLELYHIGSDIGEQRNVASRYPDVVERIEGLANAMRNRLGDKVTGVTGSENREPGRVTTR